MVKKQQITIELIRKHVHGYPVRTIGTLVRVMTREDTRGNPLDSSFKSLKSFYLIMYFHYFITLYYLFVFCINKNKKEDDRSTFWKIDIIYRNIFFTCSKDVHGYPVRAIVTMVRAMPREDTREDSLYFVCVLLMIIFLYLFICLAFQIFNKCSFLR